MMTGAPQLVLFAPPVLGTAAVATADPLPEEAVEVFPVPPPNPAQLNLFRRDILYPKASLFDRDGGTAVLRRAMQNLVARKIVRIEKPAPAPATKTLTTREAAQDMARSIADILFNLRRMVEGKHNQSLAPIVLRQLARYIRTADLTKLTGSAARAYSTKNNDVQEARCLILLGVLRSKDGLFLETYFHYLDHSSPVPLSEHLADLLFFEYRRSQQDLESGEKHGLEKVIQREGLIDTYTVLLGWAKALFAETAGVFGRRLSELGFDKEDDLFNLLQTQAKQAKEQLAAILNHEKSQPPRPLVVQASPVQPEGGAL